MVSHSKHHRIDSALLFGLAVLSVILLSNISEPLLKLHTIVAEKIQTIIHRPKITFDETAFVDIQIRGKAYVIYDILDDKIIASKNSTTTLPLASLTKVMTAYTAYSHLDKSKQIVIKPTSLDEGYDLGLKNGQSWDLSELLKYTLVFSSNDGALAIADSSGRSKFIEQMNTDSKTLGLGLQFTNPAGLDEGNALGGTGTALDVAKLFIEARKKLPQILDATTKKRVSVMSSSGRITGVPNTNQVVTTIDGIEASKTGYTDLAGGNLAVVADIAIGHPIVIVVLGSTREARFSDVELLYTTLQKSMVK